MTSAQSLGITKQIDQVLNEMKNLLTHGREVVDKHQETMVPEKDGRLREKNKSHRTTIGSIRSD